MGNGFMVPGGSGLPDRNTVGKNGAIGLNSAFPNVALNVGADCETETALDGNAYFAIKAPKGEYKGESYVGVPRFDAASIIVSAMGTTKTNNDAQGTNKDFTYTATLSEGVYIYFLCGAVQRDNFASYCTCTVTYSNGTVTSKYSSKPTNTFTCVESGVIKSNGSGTLTARYYCGDTTRNTAAVLVVYKIG